MPPVRAPLSNLNQGRGQGSPPVPRAPWAASWDASNEARFVEWRRAFTAHESAALGRRCDARRPLSVNAGHLTDVVGSLVSSDGDIHAPNRAERRQPRTHRAGLDMSQPSTRPEERSRCSIARRSPIQASGSRNAPCLRFRSPAGHTVESLRLGPTGAASARPGT